MSSLYLLIIVFQKFDPLTATRMALYCKLSQNVKIYLAYTEYAESSLAYTETKRNRLKLILNISGIDISLY